LIKRGEQRVTRFKRGDLAGETTLNVGFSVMLTRQAAWGSFFKLVLIRYK